VRIVAGFTLLIAGAAMIFLPGPGWVTIALGLALLAPDFRWAQSALERVKAALNKGEAVGLAWWRRFRTGSSAADDGRTRQSR